MWRRTLILIWVVLSVESMLIQPAVGETYPTKPIEVLVPYTPGTSADVIFRIVADIAPKYLGQPVVVINKPGAGGSVAAADVISSKPDGYKLIILTNFFFATTIKTQKVPFEQGDLVPIGNFMEFKHGFAVKGDSPWKTFGELLDYAKKNPGKLSWGHHGRGVTTHLNGLLIFKKAGVETIDIPYKGSPEMEADVLGGHLDVGVFANGAILEHLRAGKLRYLLFFSDRRYSDQPDVPCGPELGFTSVPKLMTFFGLYVHKNTPEEIKKTLIDVFNKKIFADPEVKKGIERAGETPKLEGPEFMIEAIRKGEEVGIPILKELGLYIGK